MIKNNNNNKWSPTIAVFNTIQNQNLSDGGDNDNELFDELQNQVQHGLIDIVMQMGDMISFDLSIITNDLDFNANNLLQMIEPISTRVPYLQWSPIINERDQQISKNKDKDNKININFWSYDIGPAHIIAFNDKFPDGGDQILDSKFLDPKIVNEFQLLEQDLIKANLPEQRAKHPWIIAMGHRPFNSHNKVSEKNKKMTKEPLFNLEKLFYKYGVDLNLFSNDLPLKSSLSSYYERMWPNYDGIVYNDSRESPYINAKAPVYITTATENSNIKRKTSKSGNSKRTISKSRQSLSSSFTDPINNNPILPDDSTLRAFFDTDPGFIRLQLYNETHIQIQKISEILVNVNYEY